MAEAGQISVRERREDLPARDRRAFRAAAHRAHDHAARRLLRRGLADLGRPPGAACSICPRASSMCSGSCLWPQDFFFLSWLLIIAALSLFFFTALAGRLWCGYACPQTVWTEAFLWMERLTEGRGAARRKLDKGPWTLEKIWRKTAKQALWVGFALWTGFTFVGYFTPIRELGHEGRHAVARRLGDVLGALLRLRDLRQRGLHARASLQVHVPVCALPERDVRPRYADHLLRSGSAASRAARARAARIRRSRLGDCIDCTNVCAGLPHGHRHPQRTAVRVHRLRGLHRRLRRRHGQDAVIRAA